MHLLLFAQHITIGVEKITVNPDMVGRVMAPKDIHALTPRTYDYAILLKKKKKKDFLNGIKDFNTGQLCLKGD